MDEAVRTDDTLFAGGGEMGALLRSVDWSRTPVGAVSTWPVPLRTTVGIVLANRFPMLLWWGQDLIQIYNDGYRPVLGDKHPASMAASGREVWSEIWHIVGPLADGVLAGGPAVLVEHLFLPMTRRGFVEETFFTFSYSPVPDEHGGVGGVLVTVQETTEQVQAHRQLRLLRDFAAAIAQSRSAHDAAIAGAEVLASNPADLPFALVFLSEDDASPRLAAHTGLREVDLVAAKNTRWPFGDALRQPEVIIVDGLDFRCASAAGEPVAVTRAVVLPLRRDAGDSAYGYVVAGLTPLRKLDDRYRELLRLTADHLRKTLATAHVFEEERRRADALAAIDRAKTAFFSNVSHEFRTPLTLMLGPTEDALSSPERALRGEQLELVHRNELRLLKLVNTLLDFSRAEAGRLEAAYEATDLATFTTELASSFRSAIERGGLQFDVECDPVTEPVFVDRDMWEKIVLNLLSNALKFTFEGGVRVALRFVGENAELSVSDTGAGIPEHELSRVFERFHRIEGTRSRTHEGSGIGLALARDLAKLHGGDIRVTSIAGRGTTFTVSIPRGQAHVPAERIVSARATTARLAPSYLAEALRWLPGASEPESKSVDRPTDGPQRSRILVADDNADMREYVARLLREHWTVETVADGVEALAMLDRQQFDLVVSDVMMPRLDGFGLVKALRSNVANGALPIILLSARAGDEAIADGLRTGADDYLVKPFSASTLIVRVEAQLAAARAREALRRHIEGERERLRALFEVSPAAVAVLRGRDLIVELANQKMLDIWGKSADVIGRPVIEAHPGAREQGFERLLQDVLRTGVAHRGKEVMAGFERDGTTELTDLYFDFVFAPMRDGDGRITGVLVHSFEVTELVRQRRVAETANRMKDEFLATMSHELRTPLNSILGWSTLLLARGQDEQMRHKALTIIQRNAQAQARLIEDILDVSRIISGKLRLNVSRVDLAGVVAAAVDVVRPAADAKAISLRLAVPPEDTELNGDADRLQQVVWNLLSNAVRFTPSGGTVEVRIQCLDGSLLITVHDDGIGIAPEHVPHVFERFRQVDSSTSRKHGGLGLGLAIVRHLVELHGGTVGAESGGANRGATFTVCLPTHAVIVPESDTHLSVSVARPQVDTTAALKGVRVLVVDDDEDSRDLIAHALEGAGASVTRADSAATAFDLLPRARVDVLISDIGMPDEDGYSFIRRVRQLPEQTGGAVPAIAVTAYARADDERLALSAGYHVHVAKPIDPIALSATVSKLVRARRERAE